MRYFEIVFASPDTTVEAYNRGADGYATCIRGIIKQEAIPSYDYDKENLDKRKMFTGGLFGILDSMKTEW